MSGDFSDLVSETNEAGFEMLGDWLRSAWAKQANVHSVNVENGLVSFRTWGDNDGRPGFVFVHGFRATARWWDHIAPHFADRFYVVAIDLAGMGDSGTRPFYSRRSHGEEIAAVIGALRLSRTIIAAHSYGTFATLHAARIRPVEIEHLILIDGFPSSANPMPYVPQKYTADASSLLARYRLLPPGKGPDPRITRYLADSSIRKTRQGWTWKFHAEAVPFLNDDQQPANLGNVPQPVDFIYGEHTEVVPMDRIERLSQWLPTSFAPVVIPASHHHVMVEQPVALVAALKALVARFA